MYIYTDVYTSMHIHSAIYQVTNLYCLVSLALMFYDCILSKIYIFTLYILFIVLNLYKQIL